MAEENVAEYTAAETGREAYAAYLEEEFMPVMLADADDLAEAMGGLLPPADKAAMDRGFTEWLTETFHRAGAQRTAGVLDDGQAAVRPWGFDIGSITVPRWSTTGVRTRWCRSRTESGWPRTCPESRRT